AQNGQSRADQRQKLLVENQERLQLYLAPFSPAHAAARLHAEHVVARVHKPRPQLVRARARLHLLLHPAALIGQPDYKLCHTTVRPTRSRSDLVTSISTDR